MTKKGESDYYQRQNSIEERSSEHEELLIDVIEVDVDTIKDKLFAIISSTIFDADPKKRME